MRYDMKFHRTHGLVPGLILCLGLLAACQSSGPSRALSAMARALQQNDSATFMAHIDVQSLAASEVRNLTGNSQVIGALDSIGRMLGFGNVGDLVGQMVDVPGRISRQLEYGVSTGELMARCRRDTEPGCPWAPESLEKGQVTEVGKGAAIARVTSPTGITTWLALALKGKVWQVVGLAPLESQARACALGQEPGASQPPASAPKPEKPAQPQGAQDNPVEI